MKGDESYAGGGPTTIVAAGNQPIPPATHDSCGPRPTATHRYTRNPRFPPTGTPAIRKYPGILHNPPQPRHNRHDI